MSSAGGHVFWRIEKISAILVKDLPYIVPVKFPHIGFSGSRGDDENMKVHGQTNVKRETTLLQVFKFLSKLQGR